MKIAIISDVHDNTPYLRSFFAAEKFAVLLICGDVGNIDTINLIAELFSGKIYFVFGNADTFDKKDIPKNIINLGESGIIELDHKKIGLCHEPRKIVETRHGVSLLKQKPQIIFYGHTHKPWLEEKENVLLINPGSLGQTPSTYAVWDTGRATPELIRTEI
ncbi:MAG: YfcE family phosphodiesterase [Candidatus Falkowbacteria bacterium]|nr:YfcE family phosphodiesterase [Candidatus Falkowbacteria bacterium]